jgi:hypothetical protein
MLSDKFVLAGSRTYPSPWGVWASLILRASDSQSELAPCYYAGWWDGSSFPLLYCHCGKDKMGKVVFATVWGQDANEVCGNKDMGCWWEDLQVCPCSRRGTETQLKVDVDICGNEDTGCYGKTHSRTSGKNIPTVERHILCNCVIFIEISVVTVVLVDCILCTYST